MTADETTQAQTTTETKEPEKVDIRNLQDKFHGLLDQRNHYNDLAREARDARNLLNDARAEKSKEIDEHKKTRDQLNDRMREHKERRNAYQDQAKALISEKKGKTGALERSLPLQVRRLKADIQGLLEKQETTVMTPAKENALVDQVKQKRRELAELEAKLEKQKALTGDLDDTDSTIDDLFKKADAEHEKVVEFQKRASEHHDKFVAAIKEVRTISSEADDKHKEFIAYRKKADEFHEKAMELREKVMEVKGERAAHFKAQRDEIRGVNQRAMQAVNNPEARKKAEDNALDMLKKGGKISL